MSGGIWNALLAAAAIAFLAASAAAQEESPEPTRFLDRETLTGTWGGIRPSLADHGISIDAAYTLDLLWNVRGGIDTGRATRSNLNISFEWDTEKAGAWDGGLFGLEFQSTQGASLTEQFVGDFQSLTNLDAEDFTRVSQFWYRHTFADGRFWVQIGKQDANAEIGAVNYTGGFLHSSAGLNPTVPIVSYPDYDLGIIAAWAPNDRFSLKLGLLGGDPDGGRSVSDAFDNLRDPIVYAEGAWSYTVRDLAGAVRFGHWWAAGTFEILTPAEEEPTPFDRFSELQEAFAGLGAAEPVPPAPPTPEQARIDRILSLTDGVGELYAAVTEAAATLRAMKQDTAESGAHGFYANWDQALYRENPSNEDDAQGLGVFAHYG